MLRYNYFGDMDLDYHVISMTRAKELNNADLRRIGTRNIFYRLFHFAKVYIPDHFKSSNVFLS